MKVWPWGREQQFVGYQLPEPDCPLVKVPGTASDVEWYRAALAELLLRAGYEVRLKAAAVAACQ